MRFLGTERAELERMLPGLDATLAGLGLGSLEHDAGAGLAAFKKAKGPGLLVPEDVGGLGASPVAAVRIQRAIGSRSPSLAVATTMHHFSVATMVEMTTRGLESMLLEAVAVNSLLVASGFGEGNPGQSILSPTMSGIRAGRNIVLSGSKRPCSLGRSMDLLTVSVMIEGRLAIVMVPPSLPGVTRRAYWRSPALMGAESCEVSLTDVEVPERLVSYAGGQAELDASQVGGFLWFETLICASYVGVASALVDLALRKSGPMSAQLTTAVGKVEMAMAAIERVAQALEGPGRTEDLLARALMVRYGVEDAVFSAAATAAELVGGTGFATLPEVALVLAGARALAYHPPSRARMAAPLGEWLNGERLRVH